MALEIGANQQTLHSTSKQIFDAIKKGTFKYWDGALKYKNATSKEEEPQIPSVNIFKALMNVAEEKDPLPTAAECTVHLEFLAVLHTLRQQVIDSEELDEIFDIKPEKKTVVRKGVDVELRDTTFWTRREAKWDKYIELAVVRFLAWWGQVPEIFAPQNSESFNWESKNLPPLDILMVWHSFLLNPRWFRESCADGKKLLYRIDFPWADIHFRIISDDWSFSLSNPQSESFKDATGLKPDLFETLLDLKSYTMDLRKSLIAYTHGSITLDEVKKTQQQLKTPDQHLLQHMFYAQEDFAKKLKDAVLRQVSFVDKMWDRLWIRSPALEGTVRRARDRYSNFLKLFRLYPTTMFVPTLDIDLVWHTHQCSPSRYYTITQEVAGKFVNHDDSIVQSKLDTGLTDTKTLYRIRFGKEYHVCGCWECEMLQSVVEDMENFLNWEDVAKQVSEDVAYYRAVEVARRAKKPLPIRPARYNASGVKITW